MRIWEAAVQRRHHVVKRETSKASPTLIFRASLPLKNKNYRLQHRKILILKHWFRASSIRPPINRSHSRCHSWAVWCEWGRVFSSISHHHHHHHHQCGSRGASGSGRWVCLIACGFIHNYSSHLKPELKYADGAGSLRTASHGVYSWVSPIFSSASGPAGVLTVFNVALFHYVSCGICDTASSGASQQHLI